MRLTAIVFSFFAIILLNSARSSAQNIDVWAENVHTSVGSSGYIRFFCSSNVPLSGLRIPIKLESSSLIIDSVVVGPLTPNSQFNLQILLTDAKRKAFVNILPKLGGSPATFLPYDDEVLRIHYYVKPNASEVNVPVDTFYNRFFDANFWITEQLEASDQYGLETYYPDFQSGIIWIDQATDVETDPSSLPTTATLEQNFPNPFNPSTTIVFSVTKKEPVKLEVFNLLGQQVVTLVNGIFDAGRQEIVWDARLECSGLYFYRLTTRNGTILRKMTLLK